MNSPQSTPDSFESLVKLESNFNCFQSRFIAKSLHPWQFILESNELFLRFMNTLQKENYDNEALLKIYTKLSGDYDAYRNLINAEKQAHRNMEKTDQEFYENTVRATKKMMATIKECF